MIKNVSVVVITMAVLCSGTGCILENSDLFADYFVDSSFAGICNEAETPFGCTDSDDAYFTSKVSALFSQEGM